MIDWCNLKGCVVGLTVRYTDKISGIVEEVLLENTTNPVLFIKDTLSRRTREVRVLDIEKIRFTGKPAKEQDTDDVSSYFDLDTQKMEKLQSKKHTAIITPTKPAGRVASPAGEGGTK